MGKPNESPSVITANVIIQTYTFISIYKNAIYFNFVTVGCSKPYGKKHINNNIINNTDM